MTTKESEVKMMIVMRKDLNMRKGKMVAQGSHAAVGLALQLENIDRRTCAMDNEEKPYEMYQKWLESSFKKICVSVNSEAELNEVLQKADGVGLANKLIKDAGHTEFNGVPTKTCCAILGYSDDLEPITGKLPLL